MLTPPEILVAHPTPPAVIRLTIARAEMRQVMVPAIHGVIDMVTKQDVGPAGPVFSRHFRIDPKVFDSRAACE